MIVESLTYQSVLSQQVLLGKLLFVKVAQLEGPAHLGLSIPFTHLHNPFPFQPCLLVLKVENHDGAGREEEGG